MKKKSKSSAAPKLKLDPYLEGLMSKLLDRLVSLEKKKDVVISQTARNVPERREAIKPVHTYNNKPPVHRERVLYGAVCAECSKECEVPFKPSQNRAVYCHACFSHRKSETSNIVSKPDVPVPTPVAKPRKRITKPAASRPKKAVSKAPKKATKKTAVKKTVKKKPVKKATVKKAKKKPAKKAVKKKAVKKAKKKK